MRAKTQRAFLCVQKLNEPFYACKNSTSLSMHAKTQRAFLCMQKLNEPFYACKNSTSLSMRANTQRAFLCVQKLNEPFYACKNSTSLSMRAKTQRAFLCMQKLNTIQSKSRAYYILCIQLFQLRLSPSKAEKSNTSTKSLLGVTIKNTQTEQNLVSRDTYSRDLYS